MELSLSTVISQGTLRLDTTFQSFLTPVDSMPRKRRVSKTTFRFVSRGYIELTGLQPRHCVYLTFLSPHLHIFGSLLNIGSLGVGAKDTFPHYCTCLHYSCQRVLFQPHSSCQARSDQDAESSSSSPRALAAPLSDLDQSVSYVNPPRIFSQIQTPWSRDSVFHAKPRNQVKDMVRRISPESFFSS